ncbi:aspartyl-phosphate phosphatase Spo0E family protein [Paenibacillus sp. IHBB 10380]|uniref:aspartyl-phosphate phosphatase Spo0E family protein n=1 Tax=Paenibacillus sp. IHBB 10380 TaxID=1566358 RepID=UPI0009E2A1A9|nr:aspartyl-phosphate phosphatase Spo0E family protein [Paenibacillus sp. IHBB 10380]
MKKPEVILERIDVARSKLYQMEKKHGGFLHPNVIKQSMRLDELINKYNRFYLKTKN